MCVALAMFLLVDISALARRAGVEQRTKRVPSARGHVLARLITCAGKKVVLLTRRPEMLSYKCAIVRVSRNLKVNKCGFSSLRK